MNYTPSKKHLHLLLNRQILISCQFKCFTHKLQNLNFFLLLSISWNLPKCSSSQLRPKSFKLNHIHTKFSSIISQMNISILPLLNINISILKQPFFHITLHLFTKKNTSIQQIFTTSCSMFMIK